MRPGVKKTLKWSGLGLGTVILLLLAVVCWLLFTTSGARWVAGIVTSRFAPQVSFVSLDGTIAGELMVRDFQFKGPPDAAQIRIAELSVEPTLMMLFSRVLRIENARVRGLVVTLPVQPGPEEPDKPMWVQPPLDILVDNFALLDGRIEKGGARLFAVRQLDLSAEWHAEELRLHRLTLLPGDIEGTLDVQGRVTPAGKLVRGEIDARWSKVVVPEKLAGRVLHTQGELRFDGTPVAYAVTGKLDAGPPGETTHAVLDVKGTDKRVDIRELDLTQRAGRLGVKGNVEFAPVAWQLTAKARDFNPGELLAGWPGRVNLDATTRGVVAEAGPQGSLNIASLAGELRGRPIAGEGDIEFAAPSRLEGDLQLSSGKSRVAVTGNATNGNEVDATVKLAVASLNDWVPDTAGSLTGDFRVRGRWPELRIAGRADGRALAFAENRASRLRVDASVESPLDPDGKIEARATRVAAAGIEFSAVNLTASGNQARHRVAVTADSERLDAEVEVSGGLGEGPGLRWRGELARLSLDTPDLAPLQLRAPAPVVYDKGDFSIGEACLTQEDSSLCLEANLKPDGALRASYEFARVPLSLANALAPEAMPGQLRGELAGRGDVRRQADGQWFGEATVTSPSAQMVMRDDAPGESVLGQRTLLLYENLDLRAQLLGMNATATLTAGLQHGGSLKANLAANDLTAAAPGIEGQVDASMPTLAPFGAFVPTIANLDGAVNARILLAGTAAAPEISGNVDAQKLQADLGKIGIELRDGRLLGIARSGGGFELAASVASGKGHLELAGTLSERGVIEARILGQNFQAADIPAANVTVTPDLKLTGDPKGYLLSGDLTIPRADINLQKLPQDKSVNASPDVVVIRDGKEVQPESKASALPLSAVVKVKLGENIKIVGYGLESTVNG
jgi:translocation and assembly module TamB